MHTRETLLKHISDFKARYGVQDRDEHIITTIHLANLHRLDLSSAQDQTSHGAGDHGIDGWHYDEKSGSLYIYQSKLSESKSTVLAGLSGLQQAADWLAGVLRTGEVGAKLSNAAIYNLARRLGSCRDQVRNVSLILLSAFDPNELLDCPEVDEARRQLVKSELNSLITERGGRPDMQVEMYNLSPVLPSALSSYEVPGLAEHNVPLGKKTNLQVVLLRLIGLVELFRRRGNRLFEKNVRLYLNTKESRSRLEHPLEDTLDRICNGGLDPNIFPFYHVGVTLTAGDCQPTTNGEFLLETPNVINGCQTINIADRFLRRLEKEKEKSQEKIDRFRSIPVLAKIVIAANDEQVREIANCNNRQNPIEAWQLFSNEPIHIRIEEAFQENGVFYERQKGKFDAEMKSVEILNRYYATNNTKITVEELGQIITLCRRQLQVAAKPSEVYTSKQTHDEVFDWKIPSMVHDAIWAFNAFKAAKAGLRNYLNAPAHDNEITHSIFVKPVVRQLLHYASMMHMYQRGSESTFSYGSKLNKKAPTGLVDEVQSFCRKVVSKTKNWYLAESRNLDVDVSWKKLDGFLDTLCHEAGLDPSGQMPLTGNGIDWNKYSEPADDGVE